MKSTYKQYEKRRELYSLNDIFLADDSLITTLPKLLGKVFYDSKNYQFQSRLIKKLSQLNQL